MKRLLVIGKHGGILHWYEHVLAAAAGMDAVETVGFAINRPHAGRHWLARVWGGLSGVGPADVSSRLAELFRSFRPDVCLIVDRFYLSQQVNDLLSVSGIPVHQWVGDKFDERLARNTSVSRFWFTDSGLESLARELGIRSGRWLPLAANTAMYSTPLPWEARAPEILFVGAWSRNRQDQIQQIRVPMRVIGKGWDRLNSPLHEVHPYNIAQHQLVALYHSHRYVLNVINLDNVVSGLNMRCFEATAAGACLLTDDVADLPRCFRVGDEVLAWRNVDEVAGFLLPDRAEANAAVAERGMRRTRQEHDYRHRLARILDDR